MKLPIFVTLAVSGFAVMLAGVSRLTGIHLERVLARYPASTRAAHEHLSLNAVHHGIIVWERTYYIGDQLTNVWRWYAGRFDLQPEEGTKAGDHCVKLTQVRQAGLIGRTLGVSLCSVSRGTQVSVRQRVYLRRGYWPLARGWPFH